MKGLKRKTGWMLPVSIVAFVLGVVFISAAVLGDNKGDTTTVGYHSGSTHIVTTINWTQVMMYIAAAGMIIACIVLFTFWVIGRKDMISADDEGITMVATTTKVEAKYSQIESCQVGPLGPQIKLKNDVRKYIVWYIGNTRELVNFINSKIGQ